MYGQDNYENTWKLIQLANMERLEEANRIHRAKLAQQANHRSHRSLAQILAPFGRRVSRTASVVAAAIWN